MKRTTDAKQEIPTKATSELMRLLHKNYSKGELEISISYDEGEAE